MSLTEQESLQSKEQPPSSVNVEEDGGTKAWMTILGTWLILFATFGYVYSFGVYQDYYTRFYLSSHSPSKIGWIGSFQIMMPFVFGVVSGKLFDAGHFHALELVGSAIFTISVFLLSLVKPQQYIQVFLSQGLGMGLGMGLTFVPSISVTSHHFRRRKALATGIAMTGVSMGAVVFPIMMNNLIKSIGFAKTVRATGYIVLGFLLLGNCLVRTAYKKEAKKPKPDIKSFFTDTAYMISALGSVIALFGLYFPLFYLQLYAIEHGINTNLAFYSIAIVNGSSAVGRIVGNYAADLYGPFNILVPCTFITGASIFSVFAIKNSGSLIVVCIFYGLFSGAWLSVAIAALISLARHPNEVGARNGLALAVGGFGLLGSSPVQGALLGSDFQWNKPIIFSGILLVITGFVVATARAFLVKERLTQRV